MPRKICPLCGDDFDSTVEHCPADGRLLVTEAARDQSGPGVQLSRETERLLGNILDNDRALREAPDTVAKKAVASLANGATPIGPPGGLGVAELPAPGEEDGPAVEATVTTARHLPSALSLGAPLASLGPPLVSLESAADDLDEEVDIEFEETLETSADVQPGRSGARVFADLEMESAQLTIDANVNDNDVTRRMVRGEQPHADHTRRSEMPPEFADALALESSEVLSDAEPGPSEKIEVDSTLESEADALDALKPPPKPARKVPTPSQLIVRQEVVTLTRQKQPLWPFALALLGVVAVIVVLVFL